MGCFSCACCGGGDCAKYCLFFFNFIFAISGLAIIIVGGIELSKVDEWGTLTPGTNIKTPQIVLIVVGVMTFIIATLGCCGAVRESKFMLITFAIFLLSIFIIEVAIGIFALVNFSDIKEQVAKDVEKEFKNIKKDDAVKKRFDSLQISVECCGLKGKSDYPKKGMRIPDSCCKKYENGCAKDRNFWEEGCLSALPAFLNKAGKLLGGVAIGLSLVEIIGAVLAFKIVKRIDRYKAY